MSSEKQNPPTQDTPELVHLEDREQNRDMALELCRRATQTIEIFSRDLEPLIYDRPALLETIKELALKNRKAQIRILIQDAGNIVKQGHRLVELAYRLSTYIQLRKPNVDHRNFNEAFLIIDGTGFLHRNQADRFAGTASFNHPSRARNLQGSFNEMWDHSSPDPDLRRLHI